MPALTPAQAISAYIHAKDGNRPHLLRTAFIEDVSLQMVVQTDAIDFPPTVEGVGAVADVLVSRFNLSYENIYTLCLCAAPDVDRARAFSSDWLVAMTEKGSGVVRLGHGRYDWSFEPATGQVRSLRITIARMERFSPEHQDAVLGWVGALPYPWCETHAARQRAPAWVREQLPVLG
ncbi:hypothetical protein FOZ76_04970 [Verticiella sediminum]|uniref:SnoaL-like domain-containing protein n=1 Tax=Verticiella sediminum TaxID=1247510 RepID=A0A556AYW7_9BURK|nr:hypothetical protein [Verticiella sediminum]TSH98140.1 hypothetical protein FOZ76_04970 [Verticiella sediminum]